MKGNWFHILKYRIFKTGDKPLRLVLTLLKNEKIYKSI